jgi:hypothetical protein
MYIISNIRPREEEYDPFHCQTMTYIISTLLEKNKELTFLCFASKYSVNHYNTFKNINTV